MSEEKSAVRGLFKSCLGCFGLLMLIALVAFARWKTLPSATAMLEPALKRYVAHWRIQDIEGDLDARNLDPTVRQGWDDLGRLLEANVKSVGPLAPLSSQNVMLQLNGTATATYTTSAVSKKDGQVLEITAKCVYSGGSWKILGIHFNSPNLLKPIAKKAKP